MTSRAENVSHPLVVPPAGGLSHLSTRRVWLGFAALMLGFFTILSASTSVATAIPSIQRDLHANLTQVEWLVDSYLITLVVFLTTFGRLGDLFGRKRIFLVGGVVFSLASVACALSRDATVLILFRAVAGLGPAMMMPGTLSLITELFPPDRRGVPMGLWGSMAGVGVGLGPVVGGVLVSNLSWHWVFWASAAMAGIVVVAASILLPQSQRSGRRPSLDLPGMALNGCFVFSLSYALVEGNERGWQSSLILGSFATAAIFLVAFMVRELRAPEPMLNLSLFCRPAFSAGILVTLFLSTGLMAIFVFLPLFLQGPQGESAIHSGLTLLPVAIAMAVVGPIGGYLADRVPPRWPIAGAMALFAVGIFWVSHLSLSTTWQWLVPPFLIIGVGLGLSSANINTAVMRAVPLNIAGAAAGVIATARQLGSVLGIAVLGAILQSREASYLAALSRHVHGPAAGSLAFTDALSDAYIFCAALLAIAAVVALFIRHGSEALPGRPAEAPSAAGHQPSAQRAG